MVKIDCVLTISAVTGFKGVLDPVEIRSGQTGSVVINNKGNIQVNYSITWGSVDDSIEFNPAEPQQIQVPAGESVAVEYQAKPRKKSLIGSEVVYPFIVEVRSSDGEKQTLDGKLVAEPVIPFWVVPLVLVLCLAVICFSFGVYYVKGRSTAEQLTQTAISMTQTAIPGGIVPTFTPVAGETLVPTEPATEAPQPTAVPTEAPVPTATPMPTEAPTVAPTNTQPVIPDVGRIAFQSNREGDPDLYIQDTGTGAIERLTSSPGIDTQPAYSPDGSMMAYMSDRTGDNEIYIANADGSNPVNITNNPASDQNPAWSLDGQWIAFATNRDGNLEIYIMRSDGSDLHNLTNNPADDQKPTWLEGGGIFFSTGQAIAFQSNRDGNQEIYLMNSDGSEQRNLTNNPSDDTMPAGAPNGNRIAFTTNRDGNLEIYLMNIDGSNQVNLTNNPAADQWPAWSPDGNWIAFISDRPGNQDIFITRDNGSEIYNVTNNPATDIVPTFQ